MLDKASGRIALPLIAGLCGAILYIASPLSFQAFCSPRVVPVVLQPAVVPSVELAVP